MKNLVYEFINFFFGIENIVFGSIIPGKTYPADQPFLQFLPPNLTESQI
jgi:hypothetical protein